MTPIASGIAAPAVSAPLLKDFAETWYAEFSVGWRRTYKSTVRQILDKHLLPAFGEKGVGNIRREDILAFRSQLAKVRGRKEGSQLSPRRMNAITLVLRQVLNEAADRFHFTSPGLRIKPLKMKRTDIQPLTLDEVNCLVNTVRPDYRNYLTVRCLTGLRTGECDGLKWKYVDFERREILICESYVHGQQEEETKTLESRRRVQMSGPVLEALRAQFEATGKLEYVFCNREGQPIDANNFTKRVWYPLLRHLGLALRNPYQMRHTAATLWLAAGENPEWIARQLGHVSTEMLFRVYSRYVPNLTRQDGSAFERLLLQSGTARPAVNEFPSQAGDAGLSQKETDHV
jgi:integrase